MQKAIAIRPDYRELARKTHAFDNIRQDESFLDLVEGHEAESVNRKK